MKFAAKPIQQYPPHLRHYTALQWEIKNSNSLQIISKYGKMQTNCTFSASVLIPLHI